MTSLKILVFESMYVGAIFCQMNEKVAVGLDIDLVKLKCSSIAFSVLFLEPL